MAEVGRPDMKVSLDTGDDLEGEERELAILGKLMEVDCHPDQPSWAEFSRGQQAAAATAEFERKVASGGFEYYFHYSYAPLDEAVARGLALFQARPYLEMFARAMAAFPGGRPPAEMTDRQEILSDPPESLTETLEELDMLFDEQNESDEDLCHFRLRYVDQNVAEFFDVEGYEQLFD